MSLPLQETFIHPTAIVDEGCVVGTGSQIWHFAHLMSGAQIGQQCTIGQNVFIASGVVVGNRVKIQNNVSLYAGVVIEDEVFLGPSCVFTNIRHPRSAISRKEYFEQTIVRKGATIGANATLVCGIEIGSYAFVGAGAVITRNVPAYALVVGNPARQIGWVSAYGHRLYFDEQGHAICHESGEHYALIRGRVQKV
ncbi:MAG: N-acetyltransferase [Thermoflavifilum sp.]|nr:N-acetyltransferase [Thermoflavifilum sp.]